MLKLEIIRNCMIPRQADDGISAKMAMVGETYDFEDDDLVAYKLVTCKKAKVIEGDASGHKKKMSAKAQAALVGTTTAKV